MAGNGFGEVVVEGDLGEVEVEGSKSFGFISDPVPEVAARLARGRLGSVGQVNSEIDTIKQAIRDLWQMEPDIAMRMCSALGARLAELHVDLNRAEGGPNGRVYRNIRTQHVRTLNEEVERQYRIASRLLEVRRQDIELTR